MRKTLRIELDDIARLRNIVALEKEEATRRYVELATMVNGYKMYEQLPIEDIPPIDHRLVASLEISYIEAKEKFGVLDKLETILNKALEEDATTNFDN